MSSERGQSRAFGRGTSWARRRVLRLGCNAAMCTQNIKRHDSRRPSLVGQGTATRV